jgi:CRP-like cAMP-binding protein
MARQTPSNPPLPVPTNRLLALLPTGEYELLLPHLQPVTLAAGTILQPAYTPAEWVYFPTTCIASALAVMTTGTTIEVGTIGREGVVGSASTVLGVPVTARQQVLVQVAGEALRLPANVLLREAARNSALRRVLALHHAALHAQTSQSVACNGLHPVGRRCCRWLLVTHDRVGRDQLHLTHEFLGVMLGVRRASVSDVLAPLRKRGLIHSTRGVITVRNRTGLEAAACECYRVVREEFDRLLG